MKFRQPKLQKNRIDLDLTNVQYALNYGLALKIKETK